MSSREFAAELTTSSSLRRAVVASGVFMAIAGVVCIVSLPFEPIVIIVFSFAWIVASARKTLQLLRAYATYRRIRIAAGGAVTLRGVGGDPVAAELLPGSVVLERVAWLYLGVSNGLRFGELIAGNPRKNKEWRRLQVIWRHL